MSIVRLTFPTDRKTRRFIRKRLSPRKLKATVVHGKFAALLPLVDRQRVNANNHIVERRGLAIRKEMNSLLRLLFGLMLIGLGCRVAAARKNDRYLANSGESVTLKQ